MFEGLETHPSVVFLKSPIDQDVPSKHVWKIKNSCVVSENIYIVVAV